MATKEKLDHSQIVERPRAEWERIFNLTEMSYGTKLTSYKGNQPLVYVPDFVCRVTHFKPHCAVICCKRVFDKFDDGIRMNTVLAYLRKPDRFPDEYAEGPRSYIKRNRGAVIAKIISEDDPETLDAYLRQFEKVLELTELDDMLAIASESLNVRAFLMERKARLYSPEKQEQLEIKQQEIDLGMRERTLTEWKAIWSFKTNEDGTIVLTGYKGNDTDVAIPANIGKYMVSSLGDYALSPDAPRITGDQKERRSRIQTVTIQEGILHIGESAFASCSCLLSVFLPDTLSDLGGCVFSGCSSLRDVVIPDSVKSIGADAFSHCENMTHVKIPDGVTSIGNGAFRSCSSLTRVTIPDGVTSIGDRAFFWCGSLTNVTIPDSVTSIGDAAFHDCSSLTNVTIPEGVTSIGESAFWGCSGLTSVTFPESVICIGDNAFRDCSSLTSVTLPEGVTSIGESAFWGCSGLTSVTFPDSVTSIGDAAFCGCSGLTSLTIPDGVTSIGVGAFRDCKSLTSVTLPDSVTSIGGGAFRDCRSLTSVTIPDSVTYIGSWAFQYCRKLADAAGFVIVKGVLYDYDGPGGDVLIPEGVTSIDDDAFHGCSGLTSVTIPDGVTYIGRWAFRGCRKLMRVMIPASVHDIEYGAFDNCPNLTIHAPAGSYAEQYAKESNIPFVAE